MATEAQNKKTDTATNGDDPKPASTSSNDSKPTGAQTTQGRERNLSQETTKDKEQKTGLTTDQLKSLIVNEINKFAVVFGMDEKAKQNAIFFAGNEAKAVGSIAGLKEVVLATMEKVTGIPKGVLNLAQQQANMALACVPSPAEALCTFSPGNGGVSKQQTAGITPPSGN